jgi:hypothetical protein
MAKPILIALTHGTTTTWPLDRATAEKDAVRGDLLEQWLHTPAEATTLLESIPPAHRGPYTAVVPLCTSPGMLWRVDALIP